MNILAEELCEIVFVDVKSRKYCLRDIFRSSITDNKTSFSGGWYSHYTDAHLKGTSYINCEKLQAKSLRDGTFGCDWVGTPIPFQQCLMFVIAAANKEFKLTAGKFVLVTNVTMMNVCI